ncbi:MAG: hypothetical protein ACREXR_24355, partial [Gammaproteobacteria bacterium]
MLEFYVGSDTRLRHLRQCPLGEHLEGFAGWLRAAGYQRRPAQLALRGAAHLGHWTSARGVPTERLDEEVLDAFARHLPTCACAHAFQGHDDYHVAGARRFIEHVRAVGVLPPIDAKPETVAPFIERFSDWMRHHRGVTESTLTNYMPLVKEFVASLGDDPTTYDTRRVRAFIFARASGRGAARAKSVVNAVRMFLRFLAVYGYCSPDLVAAVPGIAQWKLSSLPRYISASAIEQLVATCD